MAELNEERVDDRYLLAHLSGEPLSPTEAEDRLAGLVERAMASRLDLVIQRDDVVENRTRSMDMFHLASLLERFGFDRKLALVFPQAMHRDNLDFFEHESRRRGLDVAIFSHLDDALAWLERTD